MEQNLYADFFKVQKEHWWFVAKKKIILSIIDRFAQQNKNQRILDAGCGPGLMLNDLKQFGVVSGMDFSMDAIQFSQKSFDGEVRQCNLPNNIPYEKNSFDLIIALDVIEHIDDDVKSLEALRACLKKDGIGVLTVPAYMFLWSHHDDINHHKRRYTLTEFKEKIIQAGFTIEKISYFNTILFTPIFIVRLIDKALNRIANSELAIPGKLMNSIFKTLFSIEEYLLRFLNFPFGVSVLAVVKNSQTVSLPKSPSKKIK